MKKTLYQNSTNRTVELKAKLPLGFCVAAPFKLCVFEPFGLAVTELFCGAGEGEGFCCSLRDFPSLPSFLLCFFLHLFFFFGASASRLPVKWTADRKTTHKVNFYYFSLVLLNGFDTAIYTHAHFWQLIYIME